MKPVSRCSWDRNFMLAVILHERCVLRDDRFPIADSWPFVLARRQSAKIKQHLGISQLASNRFDSFSYQEASSCDDSVGD